MEDPPLGLGCILGIKPIGLSAAPDPWPSWEGGGPAGVPPHVDVTGFLPSLSLPPCLPPCLSLCCSCLSLGHPLRTPSLAHPAARGAPPSSAFPSRLVLPAFSLSAPGGRYKACPRQDTRGGGCPCEGGWRLGLPGPGWTDSLRECRGPRWEWAGSPGSPNTTRLSLLVCLPTLCPRPPSRSALSLPPSPPSQRPRPPVEPRPPPPLPFQGAG